MLVSLSGRLDLIRPPDDAAEAHEQLSDGLRQLQDYVRALESGAGPASDDGALKTIDRAFRELAEGGVRPQP
jgi:hypothetical protein